MLSIILLSYQSENRILNFYKELNNRLREEEIEYELIIMDDCSNDSSFEIALDLEQKNNNIRSFQLSRNYTSHYSIFAGFSKVKGNVQSPYQMIFKFLWILLLICTDTGKMEIKWLFHIAILEMILPFPNYSPICIIPS